MKKPISWFRVSVQAQGRDLIDMQSRFLTAFHEAAIRRGESPATMGMFVTKGADLANAHYYFSPDTQVLAPEFLRATHAEPCPEPAEPVQFLAGDDMVRIRRENV